MMDLEQRLAAAMRRADKPKRAPKPKPCACGQVADCAKFPLGTLVVPPIVVCDLLGTTPVMHTTRGCKPWKFTPEVK